MTEPSLKPLDETQPEGAPRSAPRLSRWLAKLKHVKGTIVAIAGVGAVLSGLVGWYTTYRTVTSVAAGPTLSVDAGPLSIVVLPFANQTGDPAKAYVADGLTSSVTADLSRIRDAYVAAPATAFSLRDKGLNVQQVGQAVGVHFVLQGSVLASGENLRIQVQLADAQSGAQLWTDTYEGSLSDLFALQDKVTTRVGNSLNGELVLAAARASETHKSGSKVVDLLLQARALSLQPQTAERHQRNEALYRQILKLEPGQVQAALGLATTLLLEATNFQVDTGEEASKRKVEEADKLIAQAREVDPQNPSVFNALTISATARGDLPAQLEAAKTFAALAPKNPSAFNALGLAYLFAGDAQQAIQNLHHAIELNPRGAREVTLDNLGSAYYMAGDNAAASDMFRQAIAKNPRYVPALADLAVAYASQGDSAHASQAVTELLRVRPTFRVKDLGSVQTAMSPAFRDYLERKLLPDARKAGIPD